MTLACVELHKIIVTLFNSRGPQTRRCDVQQRESQPQKKTQTLQLHAIFPANDQGLLSLSSTSSPLGQLYYMSPCYSNIQDGPWR